jgi:hypothetical protein
MVCWEKSQETNSFQPHLGSRGCVKCHHVSGSSVLLETMGPRKLEMASPSAGLVSWMKK